MFERTKDGDDPAESVDPAEQVEVEVCGVALERARESPIEQRQVKENQPSLPAVARKQTRT